MLPHNCNHCHEHETELLSSQWHLTSKILRTITRMTTTAINHPIHAWITWALKDGNRSYISNLENLIKHYPEYIQPSMKHIAAYIRLSWWKLAVIIRISTFNKDEVTKEHQQRLQQILTQDLIIYINESSHKEQIDAIIYSLTNNIIKRKYIDTNNIHNIYTMELMIIQMIVMLFEEKIQEYSNVYIFTDNQFAI